MDLSCAMKSKPPEGSYSSPSLQPNTVECKTPPPDLSLTPAVAIAELQFPFKANDELIHLCAMDSLMPTANRRLESSGNSVAFSLTTQFMDGDPLLLKPSLPSNPLGAWASPLKLGNSSLSQEPLPQNLCPNRNLSGLSSQWPSLSASRLQPQQISPQIAPGMASKTPGLPAKASNEAVKASMPLSHLKTQALEFPWAAKLHATRNLHRVTTPVFMEDGTPKVTIPSQILLEGIENQKEYVVGQFYRCAAPSGGQIHAVVSRIWGRRCKIYTRKLTESSYMFHIPDENTRNWVLSRGLWHVDDCLMFVSSWNPSATFSLPEINTVPVWLTLKNIPNQLYSFKGIERIASRLGELMLTNKPWLDPTLMGEAKILVEVKLDKLFHQKVALEDESGSISFVDVVYSWLPSKCTKCCQLGHKASRCLGLSHIQSKNTEVIGSVSSFLPKVIFNSTDPSFQPSNQSAISHAPSATIASLSTVEVETSTLPVTANEPTTESESVETATINPVIETAIIEAIDPAIVVTPTIEVIVGLPLISETSPTETENVSFSETATTQIVASEFKSPSTHLTNSSGGEELLETTAAGTEISSVSESIGDVIANMEEEVEVPPGNNRFDLLGNQRADLDTFTLQDVDTFASSQRNLRERPIKPPQKFQESQWQTVQRGR